MTRFDVCVRVVVLEVGIGQEAGDAVVAVGADGADVEGQVVGAPCGGEFVEAVAEDVDAGRGVPAPRGVAVGKAAGMGAARAGRSRFGGRSD